MPEIKIKGKSYNTIIGSRAEVWHGNAFKTSGGLTKSHLFKNKSGRIVSKAKHNTAKKDKRLLKAGYGTKKGHFGFVRIGQSKKTKGSRKQKGGYAGVNYALSPSTVKGMNGPGSTSGVAVQFAAGNASS